MHLHIISENVGILHMGGKGSSRWNEYRKKVTVEACKYIDVNRLTQARILRVNSHSQGRWIWKNARIFPTSAPRRRLPARWQQTPAQGLAPAARRSVLETCGFSSPRVPDAAQKSSLRRSDGPNGRSDSATRGWGAMISRRAGPERRLRESQLVPFSSYNLDEQTGRGLQEER